jgi:hypothetical protein
MKVRRDRWSGFLVLVVLAFVAGGCDKDKEDDDGSSCNSLCEQAQRCPASDQNVDCRSQCDKFVDILRNAGCKDDYDDLLSCIDDEPDICMLDEYACQSENATVSGCINSYCTNHVQECNDALS